MVYNIFRQDNRGGNHINKQIFYDRKAYKARWMSSQVCKSGETSLEYECCSVGVDCDHFYHFGASIAQTFTLATKAFSVVLKFEIQKRCNYLLFIDFSKNSSVVFYLSVFINF